MTYNARKAKNRRTMSTKGALKRLFNGRKHRKCAYCGKNLSIESASFDHVKPLSRGGYDKTRNGAIACRPCNSRKGSMSREQFVNLLNKEAA